MGNSTDHKLGEEKGTDQIEEENLGLVIQNGVFFFCKTTMPE